MSDTRVEDSPRRHRVYLILAFGFAAAAVIMAGGFLRMLHNSSTQVVPAAAAQVAPAPAASSSAPAKVIIRKKVIHRTIIRQVPVAPAVSALTDCGSGVLAGASTSCPFALNVRQDYYNAVGSSGSAEFYSYSPVTGQEYLMRSTSTGNPVIVTGGNGAYVQFSG